MELLKSKTQGLNFRLKAHFFYLSSQNWRSFLPQTQNQVSAYDHTYAQNTDFW